jgi:hypothetical protein
MLRRIDSGPALVSLLGAFVWAMMALLAGTGRAPFGILELLFLFAVLVVVPLGLDLTRVVNPDGDTVLFRAARSLQPFAALTVVTAFWLPPGRVAALLTAPWAVFALTLALSRSARLLPQGKRSSTRWIASVAFVDLLVGSGWLFLSRAGIRPMGFLEPIVLLTAVHFHFSGFAAALIAASALRLFERHAIDAAYLWRVVWLVAVLPFVLALGIAFSPALRSLAALALSASVAALAALLFWFSSHLETWTARLFVRLAASAAFVALSLASAYAVADYTGKPFLTMPAMASTHGLMNSVGFVLLTMLACLIELHEVGGDGSRESHARDRLEGRREAEPEPATRVPRQDPATANRLVPEFVARDFYDR